MKNKTNINNRNLALFIFCMIMILCFSQTTSNFLNNSNNLTKLQETNNYGFFCLPINTNYLSSSKTSTDTKSQTKLSPVRINLNGLLECFSLDGKSCLASEDTCYEQLLANYSSNKIISCPSDTSLYKNEFSWCNAASEIFFKKWLCPQTTGLNIAVKLNTTTGNVSCLSKTGDICYTDEQAEKACIAANSCNDKENIKNYFNELTCGSEEFVRKYDNIGYDAKFNNWCRKALTRYLDTDQFYYPVDTNTDVVIKFTSKHNPSCLSKDAETCLKFSVTANETEVKELNYLIENNLYTTLTCGTELLKSKYAITGYDTPKHWCISVFQNLGLELIQQLPLSQQTEDTLENLVKVYTEDLSNLEIMATKIKEINEIVKQKQSKVDLAVKEALDILEINSFTDNYLKELNAQIKLELEAKTIEVKLATEKNKFYTARNTVIQKEIDYLNTEMKKLKENPNVSDKLVSKYTDRIKNLTSLQSDNNTKINEATKDLEKSISEKKAVESKLETNDSDIKKNEDEYKKNLLIREAEKLKLMNDLSMNPILIALPKASTTEKEIENEKSNQQTTSSSNTSNTSTNSLNTSTNTSTNTPTNTSTNISTESSNSKLPIYSSKEIDYSPIHIQKYIDQNVEHFIKSSTEMGFDIKSQQPVLTSNYEALQYINYKSNSKTNEQVKELIDAIKIKATMAEKNPYSVDVSKLEKPYNTEPELTKSLVSKKELTFFSKLGTQILSSDVISLTNIKLNKSLKSYNLRYIKPSTGSKQQEVSGGDLVNKETQLLDSFSLWEIEHVDISDISKTLITPLKHNSVIRLKHVQTNKYLYSQPKIKSPTTSRQEVSCYTGNNDFFDKKNNTNSLFTLQITFSLYKDELFRVGDNFRLLHYSTNLNVGMGEYLTPRSNENEVFAFRIKETIDNNKISGDFIVTSVFSDTSNKQGKIPPYIEIEKKELIEPNKNSEEESNDTVSLVINDGAIPETSPVSSACGKNMPFCFTKLDDTCDPLIVGNSLKPYLTKTVIEKIGASVSLNDDIKIYNPLTGLYLSILDEKSISGSYKELIVGNSNNSSDNKNNILKYLWKKDDGKKKVFEIEVLLNNIQYKVFTRQGFYSQYAHQQQVSGIKVSDIIEIKPNFPYTLFYIEEIESVTKDNKENNILIGNSYVIRSYVNNCYLTMTDFSIQTKTPRVNDKSKIQELVCLENFSQQALFVITEKKGVDMTKDYLNYIATEKTDSKDIIKINDTKKQKLLEDEIKQLNEKKLEAEAKIKLSETQLETVKDKLNSDPTDKASLDKRKELEDAITQSTKTLNQAIEDIKKTEKEIDNEKNNNTSIFDSSNLKELTQIEISNNCISSEENVFPSLRKSKCLKAEEIIKNEISNSDNANNTSNTNNNNNTKSNPVTIIDQIVMLKHHKTKAYLNNSKDTVGFLKQNIGNFWKIGKSPSSTSDNVLTHYLSGQNLTVIKETNKENKEKLLKDSIVYTAGYNGINNSNDIIEFYNEKFEKLNEVKSTDNVLIRFKNRECFLAFVPNKITKEEFYLTYCFQKSEISNVPVEYLKFSFELVTDDTEINDNEIVEKKIEIGKKTLNEITDSLKKSNDAYCCDQKTSNIKDYSDTNITVLDNKNKETDISIKSIFKKIMTDDYVQLSFSVSNDSSNNKKRSIIYSTNIQYNNFYQQLIFGYSSDDSEIRNLSHWKIVTIDGSKYVENNEAIRLVHRFTGKCLSANKISVDKDVYITYAAGYAENCDLNSNWIVKKKSSLISKNLANGSSKNTEFDDRIGFSDEIVLVHERNPTFILSYLPADKLIKGSSIANTSTSTTTPANISKTASTSSKSQVVDYLVLVSITKLTDDDGIKLSFLGKNTDTDNNFYNNKLLDNYEELKASSKLIRKTNQNYNILSEFKRQEDLTNWYNPEEIIVEATINQSNSKSSDMTKGKVVEFFKIIKLLTPSDPKSFKPVDIEIPKENPKDFNPISEIKYKEDPKNFNAVTVNNVKDAKNFYDTQKIIPTDQKAFSEVTKLTKNDKLDFNYISNLDISNKPEKDFNKYSNTLDNMTFNQLKKDFNLNIPNNVNDKKNFNYVTNSYGNDKKNFNYVSNSYGNDKKNFNYVSNSYGNDKKAFSEINKLSSGSRGNFNTYEKKSRIVGNKAIDEENNNKEISDLIKSEIIEQEIEEEIKKELV